MTHILLVYVSRVLDMRPTSITPAHPPFPSGITLYKMVTSSLIIIVTRIHSHTCIYNLWSLFSDALCACLQSRSQHAYDWLMDNSFWNATGLWNGLLLKGFVTPFSSQLASDVNISISHFSGSHSCHGIQQLCLRLSLNLTNKMVPVHFLDYQHIIHSPLH